MVPARETQGVLNPSENLDAALLDGIQSVLSSSAIADLRVQQFWTTFRWKLELDNALSAFHQWGLIAEHRFLDNRLEEVHARLRELSYTLFDRIHRYTEKLPMSDIAAEDSRRVQRVCASRPRSRHDRTGKLAVMKSGRRPESCVTRTWNSLRRQDSVLRESKLLRRHSTPRSHDMGCDLELVTWHAGARGRLPSFWPDDESNPTWISVRNIRGAPPVRARNVTARLEFVNSAQTRRLIVPEAVWFEEQHTGHRVSEKYSHAVEIEGGDEQSFIVFSTNKRGDLVPYKNGNEPLEPLGFDHWDVLIHVSSDNVHGHEAHSGFTVTRHSYVHDMPYFIKQLRVPPKVLQQGEQSAE